MGQVSHQSSHFFLRQCLLRLLYLHAIGCVELGSAIAYNESGRHHFWAQMFWVLWLSVLQQQQCGVGGCIIIFILVLHCH